VPVAALRLAAAFAAGLGIVAVAQAVVQWGATEPRASAYVVLEPYVPVQLSGAKAGVKARAKAPRRDAVEPDDPLWRVSWSLRKIGAPVAWTTSRERSWPAGTRSTRTATRTTSTGTAPPSPA
jgi:hypothetical protein